MTPTATLHATGPRTSTDWHHLTRTPMNAAWADTDGFHLTDHIPATPPHTTHLWAWIRHHWLRLRIDHPHWWGAALTLDTAPTGEIWLPDPEPVYHLTVTPILHWPPGAGEIQQRRLTPTDALTRNRMIALTPTRADTATFYGTTDTHP
ncbi:hypothetical protein AB0346_00570 [Nocardia beijingensis]|uniref:hypothetical protein n=1 Tax=Nocardia beijingensis TaxID=95162 RepID=UPI00344C2AE8